MHTRVPRHGTALSRRSFLAATGTAALTTTAGCSTVVDFVGNQILDHVNVFNETERRVGGSIELVDPASETVLDETFDLATPNTETEDEGSTTAVYGDVWTDGGSYEVTVELDGVEIDGESRASETVTIDDVDEEMLAVPLGADDLDAGIAFRVGTSLSDFASGNG